MKTQNWTIRKAKSTDAGGMGQCLDAAYAQYARQLDDLPPVSDDCAGEIERHEVFVAEAGTEIVGALVLAPGDGFMLLANVAVRPDCRGTGIGRALLEMAEAEANRWGHGEIRLNTHAGMAESVRLYRRNGWVETGRQANKVSMRKNVPS